MPQYFFILGRYTTLSIAEIISFFNQKRITYTLKILSEEAAIFLTDIELTGRFLMENLGGTVKAGRIIEEINLDEDSQKLYQAFSAESLIRNFIPEGVRKVHFGLSIYSAENDTRNVAQLEKQLPEINTLIKKNLMERGVKAGFVRNKERNLSSVSVAKNNLLSKGFEIVLILGKDKLFTGRTLAVQEYGKFAYRDVGRPCRDKRSGIMPPKLARIMINLASVNHDEILLDPFCGSGTILQEAVVLGYKNLIGSDISAKAISGSLKNIDWLFEKFSYLDRPSYNIKFFQSDIRFIADKVEKDSVGIIITEPYLGPPLFKNPDINQAQKTTREIERLYIDSFYRFYKILKDKGIIVIIFPAFEIAGKIFFVDILEELRKIGFEQVNFFPRDIINNRVIKLTARNTILYGGKEQFVKREIIKLQKKG